MTRDHEPAQNLNELLDAVNQAAERDLVSVKHVLQEFGERSITPFILLISLLLISPISGIPGVPTVSAIIIVTLAAQALAGRDHIWMPDVILRRHLSGERLRDAVDWMRKPCAFLDRHSHARLRLLTSGPMRVLTLLVCILLPSSWPMLELLPMVTSIGAATIALLTFGLFTRDGLYVSAGYGMVGILIGVVFWVWP